MAMKRIQLFLYGETISSRIRSVGNWSGDGACYGRMDEGVDQLRKVRSSAPVKSSAAGLTLRLTFFCCSFRVSFSSIQ